MSQEPPNESSQMHLTPAQLINYMNEMLVRLDKVGNRILAYAESHTQHAQHGDKNGGR